MLGRTPPQIDFESEFYAIAARYDAEIEEAVRRESLAEQAAYAISHQENAITSELNPHPEAPSQSWTRGWRAGAIAVLFVAGGPYIYHKFRRQ